MPPKITMLGAFASGHGCDFDEPTRLWASLNILSIQV